MSEIVEFLKSDPNVRQQIRSDLIKFNKQNLVTQAKKGEELVAIVPVIKQAIQIMGDDIYELGVENDILRNKMGDVDEKWLSQTKTNITSNSTNSPEGLARKNAYILNRMKNQIAKSKQV